MNKEQVYFPHYVQTRNDRRVKRLRKDMGLEGYGAFVSLFEVLREQIDYRFPLSDIDLLADEFGISEAKLKTIVMNYELFLVDIDLKFFSVDLIESIQPFLRAKEQRKNAIKARWDKNKPIEIEEEIIRPYNDRNSPVIQSKVNEIKLNENKKISIVGQAQTLDKSLYDSSPPVPVIPTIDTPTTKSLVEVVDYVNKLKGKSFKYLPKLQEKLNARTKEGYTLSDIKLATWNCFNNQYHKENPHYLTPEFILTSKNLEKYLNIGGMIPEDKPKIIERKDYPSIIDWYVARIRSGETEKTLITSDQSFDWINQANEKIKNGG